MAKLIFILIEMMIILFLLLYQILPHWNSNSTTGDFASLEIIAMLLYNIYDAWRKKMI